MSLSYVYRYCWWFSDWSLCCLECNAPSQLMSNCYAFPFFDVSPPSSSLKHRFPTTPFESRRFAAKRDFSSHLLKVILSNMTKNMLQLFLCVHVLFYRSLFDESNAGSAFFSFLFPVIFVPDIGSGGAGRTIWQQPRVASSLLATTTS